MTDGAALATTLRELDDEQVRQVLQHLLSRFDEDPEPAITQEEIDVKVGLDQAFLSELVAAAALDSTETPPDTRELVSALALGVPETAPVVEAAIAQVAGGTTLPINPDTAMDILAIATAAAILRPRIAVRKINKKNSSDLDVQLEIRGVNDLGGILQAAMQFFRSRSLGE